MFPVLSSPLFVLNLDVWNERLNLYMNIFRDIEFFLVCFHICTTMYKSEKSF